MSTLDNHRPGVSGPVSYADYLQLSDDERWEIMNGVPYNMSPAPSRRHQKVVGNLHGMFWNYLSGKLCDVYSAPFDVRLFSEGKRDEDVKDVVQPDITVVCDPTKLDDRGCNGSPDLVIEVLSPSTLKRDRKDKLNLYRRARVKEYWIVDMEKESVEVYRFKDDPDRFPDISIYSLKDQDIIPVGVLDNMEIPLANIFQ